MTAEPALDVLRERRFARFLLARFLATLAVQMQSVVVGWQVYALSGDPLDLGLVGLAQFAPFIPLVLAAGHAADHRDRLRIVNFCYGLQLLCGLLLTAFAASGLPAVWPIFAVLALFGASRAFLMPASQAVVINLVPPERFGQALSLNSSAFQVALIAGPAAGGLAYLAGPAAAYAVVSALLAAAAGLTAGIRVTARPPPPAGPTGWKSVLEGLRFVRSRPAILGAISLDLFAVLFGGATALLPAYASDILQVGPAGLGYLRSAPGIGAALTAAVLTLRPIERRVGAWMFGGVALYGVATLIFGLSRSFPLSLAALLLMGGGDMISVYIRHMLVQLETPDAIRGRVSSVNSVFIGASNELGEFESGLTAVWFGLVPAVVIGGGATLAITLTWMLLFPTLRKLNCFPRPAPRAALPPQPPARYRRYTRRHARP